MRQFALQGDLQQEVRLTSGALAGQREAKSALLTLSTAMAPCNVCIASLTLSGSPVTWRRRAHTPTVSPRSKTTPL